MSEYVEKGELSSIIGDVLGGKYIRSLTLIIVAVFLPILVSNPIFGIMSIRSLIWLGSGTIMLIINMC